MKKILSLMFAFLFIFSCFAVTAFAEDFAIDDDFNIFEAKQPTITFSEDYQKLYVDGEPFSRFNASTITADFGYTVLVEYEYNSQYYTGNSAYVKLTDRQKENIADILIERNQYKNMYRIEIYFNDGSSLTVYFLQDTCFDEYNKIISGNVNEYIVDFSYPEDNTVIAQKTDLFGETVKLNRNDLADLYETYSVFVQSSDGSMVAYVGAVFNIGENFYYIDYKETGVDSEFLYDTPQGMLAELSVHRITDEALLEKLNSAQESYYSDDYGILYDDDATESISTVFLIFIFAVVPAVILVISLVKAIRGKGIYKKIYGTVSALCIAELIVFVIIAVIFSSSSHSSPSVPDYVLGGSNSEEYVVVDTDYSNEEINEWYSL